MALDTNQAAPTWQERVARKQQQVRQYFLGSRHRAISTFIALAVLVASSIWFFTARDDRGRTARLTADAAYYHVYLPSMVFDQDLNFRNEFEVVDPYRFGKTPTGRQANVFGIGPSIYELPFFALGHGVARATGGKTNGFSRPEVELSLYASLLFSLGAVFFGIRLLRRRLRGRYGPIAVSLLVACGGPVVYYAIRQPGYAHPFAAFWAAWLVDYWDASFDESQRPRSKKFWVCLGLLVGAASLARPQLVLWSILGIYAATSDVRRGWRLKLDHRAFSALPLAWLLGVACALVVVSPQLFAWKSLYGSFIVSPQGDGFMRWGESVWLETLFSSRNGLFPWAPLYALAFIGLLAGLRRHTRVCSALLCALLLQAYANGAAWDWWAGGSFGGRRFDSCFIAFVFGVGVLIHPAWTSSATWTSRCWKGIAIAIALVASLLAGANVHFASTQSGPTVRFYGGQAASVLLRTSPFPFGDTASLASTLSNLPVRAVYAYRNGASLAAYDQLVGVHQLGELFPGLNSSAGKDVQPLKLRPRSPNVIGLQRGSDGRLTAPTGRATIIIGLNRLGPIEVQLRLDKDSVPPIVKLNDGEAAVTAHTGRPYSIMLNSYRRGSNRLTIESTPGFILRSIVLKAAPKATRP